MTEGYMPGSLGGRSICVGMQVVTAGDEISQFDNFNSVTYKVFLSRLNRFVVLIAQKKEIYGVYSKEMLL